MDKWKKTKIFFASLSLSVCLRLFSGTLVHGLIRYLKGGQAAESLLAGGSFSGHLYSSLLHAVKNGSSRSHPSSSAAGRRKRGGGRGRRGRGGRGRGARGGGRATEEMNNRFAFLMSEEESDDDWWGSREKWTVQYKALARGQRREDIPVFY